VRSQKLLNPRMWIFFNFSIFTPEIWPMYGLAAARLKRPIKSGKIGRLPRDFTEQKRRGQRRRPPFLWIMWGGIGRLQNLVDYRALFGISAGFVPLFHRQNHALVGLEWG
jgi:hypothetical protein